MIHLSHVTFTVWCYILHVSHIGMFYFNLGNIHPKYRLQLSSIQLLCIVKSNYVVQYGMDAILKPIVADILKELACEWHCYGVVMDD